MRLYLTRLCVLAMLLGSMPVFATTSSTQPGSGGSATTIRALQDEMARAVLSCAGEAQLAAIQNRLNALASQLPRHGNGSLDQGGDACADAAVITALPFCNSGTTQFATDDYAPPPPCPSSTAPDVVYAYTPTANQLVTISLCGSTFNTILHVWDGCPYTGIPPVCCNDDAFTTCAPASCCPAVSMQAGHTYYIVVDGAGSASGAYTLHVEPSNGNYCPDAVCAGCVVTCPANAMPEGEGCPPGFPDYYNAGCFNWPFAATSLNCGQTICASSYWDANYADHDAYIVTTTQRDSLIWCVYAEFDVQIDVHQYFSGG